MKKTIYLFGLLLLAGATVVSSCKKDEDEEPEVDMTPVLTFIGGTGYTDADASMAPSSTFKVGINASANVNSNSKIASFIVVRTFNNTPTTVYEDDNINEATYTWEQDLIANTQVGEERWSFTVTDKAGVMKELSFVVTTISTVTSYKNLSLGSFNDALPSFVASATGTLMSKAQAGAAQETVDFAFYLGAVNKSTFGAPSNSDVQSVFALAAAGWTTFNNTMFEMASINATEFDAIGDSYAFPAFTGTEDEVNNLEATDVVFFKTVNDKHGYIKVNSINGKGDYINIDMIVEN
ncbi:MAG: hypothetical protein DRJ15_14965 [Bacteroidetes bacterium]|nr:MAG: hypothetical protein DRJ15_14965 [Bacteroidota bacterium]